jgi:hypothetical protein
MQLNIDGWRLRPPTDFKVKVNVTLGLAVYRQSFSRGFKTLETHDQKFFNETLLS